MTLFRRIYDCIFTVFSVQETAPMSMAHRHVGRRGLNISLFFLMVANRTVNNWMDNPMVGIIACFSQERAVIRFNSLMIQEFIHPACPYCFLQINNRTSFGIKTLLVFYQVSLRSTC